MIFFLQVFFPEKNKAGSMHAFVFLKVFIFWYKISDTQYCCSHGIPSLFTKIPIFGIRAKLLYKVKVASCAWRIWPRQAFCQSQVKLDADDVSNWFYCRDLMFWTFAIWVGRTLAVMSSRAVERLKAGVNWSNQSHVQRLGVSGPLVVRFAASYNPKVAKPV